MTASGPIALLARWPAAAQQRYPLILPPARPRLGEVVELYGLRLAGHRGWPRRCRAPAEWDTQQAVDKAARESFGLGLVDYQFAVANVVAQRRDAAHPPAVTAAAAGEGAALGTVLADAGQ